MRQLTFFDDWWTEYLGLKVYSDFSKNRLTIKDIIFNYEPHYKEMIAVSFEEVQAKELFLKTYHDLQNQL